MKHAPKLFALLIAMLAVYGCGKKDTSLLGLVPVSPVVNPDTRAIIKENALVYAELAEGNQVRGLNRTHVFSTNDQFQSFTLLPYATSNTNLYKVQGKRIVFWNRNTPTPFTYSVNMGQRWQTVLPEIEGTINAVGNFFGYIEDVHFIDDTHLLLFTRVTESTNVYNQYLYKTNVYKVDLAAGKGALFSTINDCFPVEMHFIDQDRGWIHLNKLIKDTYSYSDRNALIARTSDGGRTWSTPVLVESHEPMKLAVGGEGQLYFYNSNGIKYTTPDGGTTWTRLNNTTRLSGVAIVNAATYYAVSEGGFVKSTDGGLTWNYLTEKNQDRYRYGKLSFANEQQGIIYEGQSLYMTTNGGVTWKPLLFPFAYVVD